MLNKATPILQIKISGIFLPSVKTMIITIRSINFTIVKGNSDIEIDNDLISIFLTNDEADKISIGGYNISIFAENINGEDVSEFVKVIWAKRGSMSKVTSNGDSDGGTSSGGTSLFAFEIRENGHLWIISDSKTQAQNFRINEDGHLIYTLEV